MRHVMLRHAGVGLRLFQEILNRIAKPKSGTARIFQGAKRKSLKSAAFHQLPRLSFEKFLRTALRPLAMPFAFLL
jgi:hypothetical protein